MTQLDHLGRTPTDRIPPLPDATLAAARRTVARRARDVDDGRLLLEMLGLREVER